MGGVDSYDDAGFDGLDVGVAACVKVYVVSWGDDGVEGRG